MDIDRFLATHQGTWLELGALTRRARRGVDRLEPGELDRFVALYQQTSTHLSIARTRYADPGLTGRLTRLVADAGGVLYGSRPRSVRAAGRFLTVTFPAAVWHSRWFVLVSAALLLLPALAFGTWLAVSDAAVEASAPEAVREAYLEEDFEAYYSSAPAGQFATEVTVNNIRVAILAFAAGIVFCVGTAWILALNGAGVGVAGGLFVAAGEAGKFFGLILPHGLLELSAVVVAGAAGLRLGWTIIDPGDRSRTDALAEEGRRAVVIVIGLVLAFVAAGVIEAFVTPSGLPTLARVGVGVVAAGAFWTWIVSFGRAAQQADTL